MLTKQQKSQIKDLMQRPGWEVLVRFMSLIIDKWHESEVKAPDEFNTVWNIALKTGKIEGLKEYYELLDREILNDQA